MILIQKLAMNLNLIRFKFIFICACNMALKEL